MQGTTKNQKKFNLFEISVISLFWILLFASPLLLEQAGGNIYWERVLKVWQEHIVLLILFLANRFILVPYLFLRHRRILYVISASVLIGITFGWSTDIPWFWFFVIKIYTC